MHCAQRMYLYVSCDPHSKQQEGFHSRRTLCLLRGVKWIFKYYLHDFQALKRSRWNLHIFLIPRTRNMNYIIVWRTSRLIKNLTLSANQRRQEENRYQQHHSLTSLTHGFPSSTDSSVCHLHALSRYWRPCCTLVGAVIITCRLAVVSQSPLGSGNWSAGKFKKVEMIFKEGGCKGRLKWLTTNKCPGYYLKLNYCRFRHLTNHPLTQHWLNKP